jgi:DNA-binding Lrp family transcriptional regulator
MGDKAYSDLMKELWGSPGIWNVKKTYVDIARRIGVDEETVRNRVKSLRETGFLVGWRLVPNPVLLDRSPAFMFLSFQDREAKEDAISKLARLDGTIVVTSFYGNDALISLYDDEERSSAKEITKSGIRAQTVTTPGINMPAPLAPKMTVTDWMIARAMIRNAEKSPEEIAKELKTSMRTVNRRLNSMMEERAIFIQPRVNLKAGGGVSYQLIVHAKEDKKSEVDQLVATRIGNLIFRASMPENGLIFGFIGSNVAEGTEILRWAKKIDGVSDARMNIVEDVVHVFDWLEREIDKKIEKS